VRVIKAWLLGTKNNEEDEIEMAWKEAVKRAEKDENVRNDFNLTTIETSQCSRSNFFHFS